MSRFNADQGGGFRGNPADFGSNASPFQRGGMGAEQGMVSSAPAGNPHSSTGFRRALMRTARSSGRLKDQLPQKSTFGGKGFRKPNYAFQGGQRHGMHVGAGAPAINPAEQEGASFGG